MSFARLTRKVQISCAHRLHTNKLSDEENKELYGKCNHSNSHGHNYTIEVTLYGIIDEVTGMVYNISDLKQEMEQAFVHILDHQNIDKDVPYFATVPSTTENLSLFIFKQMLQTMKKPALLEEVKIHETDKNSVSVRKGDIIS